MKKPTIFIDYSENYTLALKIKLRLENISDIDKLIVYDDLLEDFEVDESVDWETITIDQIKKSDIIIPILDEGYLDFVSPEIAQLFDEIIDSSDKFLLPILDKPSEWGSYNWVVKSKLIPSDGEALSEKTESEFESEINRLIRTIKNIIKQFSYESETKEVKQVGIDEKIIFISHNHDDADFAELLKLKLEKKGLNGWIDSERLKIGQDWREEIDLGIENSVAVIAIMTPEARKSEYVTYEWAFAWGKGKKVFPIMLKQTQLHPRLESLQYLDFTNRSSRPWEKLIESIIELVK